MNYVEVGREYNFIPGLGQALIGMKKGEAKILRVPIRLKKARNPETSGFR